LLFFFAVVFVLSFSSFLWCPVLVHNIEKVPPILSCLILCLPYPPPLPIPFCTLLSGISRQGNASVIPSGVLILPPALNALEHQVMQIFCFPYAKSGLYAQSGLIVMGKTPHWGTVSMDHIFTLSNSKHTFLLHKREQGRNHLPIKLPFSVGCQDIE